MCTSGKHIWTHTCDYCVYMEYNGIDVQCTHTHVCDVAALLGVCIFFFFQ